MILSFCLFAATAFYAFQANAGVCFLPDVDDCSGAVSAVYENSGRTDCSRYNGNGWTRVNSNIANATCESCDGSKYCKCPDGMSIRENSCVCNGDLVWKNDRCQACDYPKTKDSATTCKCPTNYTAYNKISEETCDSCTDDGSNVTKYNVASCRCTDTSLQRIVHNGVTKCLPACKSGQTREGFDCKCTGENENPTPDANGDCQCIGGFERNSSSGKCERIDSPLPERYFYVTTIGWQPVMPKIISGATVVKALGYDGTNNWGDIVNNGDLDDDKIYVYQRKYKVMENADLVIDRGYCSSVYNTDDPTDVDTYFEGNGNCNFVNIIENAREPMISLKATAENLAGCTSSRTSDYGQLPWGVEFEDDDFDLRGAFTINDVYVNLPDDTTTYYYPTGGGCEHYDTDRPCVYDETVGCWHASQCLAGETTSPQTCQEGYKRKTTQRGSQTCYACVSDICSGQTKKQCENGEVAQPANSTAAGSPCFYCVTDQQCQASFGSDWYATKKYDYGSRATCHDTRTLSSGGKCYKSKPCPSYINAYINVGGAGSSSWYGSIKITKSNQTIINISGKYASRRYEDDTFDGDDYVEVEFSLTDTSPDRRYNSTGGIFFYHCSGQNGVDDDFSNGGSNYGDDEYDWYSWDGASPTYSSGSEYTYQWKTSFPVAANDRCVVVMDWDCSEGPGFKGPRQTCFSHIGSY